MCAQYSVRPYTVWFVDVKLSIAGVLITLGIYIGFFGRKFQQVTNFIVTSLLVLFILMLVFTATFMDGSKRWVTIFTIIMTVSFSIVIGLVSSWQQKLGAIVIGAVSGFMLGILLNNAWFYLYPTVIVPYCVAATLAVCFGVFGSFDIKFNTTVIFGNAWIGAFMLLRGIAILVGYW